MIFNQIRKMIMKSRRKGIIATRKKARPCSFRSMLIEGAAAAMDRQYHITVERRYIPRF